MTDQAAAVVATLLRWEFKLLDDVAGLVERRDKGTADRKAIVQKLEMCEIAPSGTGRAL